MKHPHHFPAASAFIGLVVLASTVAAFAASRPSAAGAGASGGGSSPSGPDDAAKSVPKHVVLTGQAAFTDAAHEAPGVRRHLTVADLPEPMPEQSVDNGANVVP
ncbi:MAG: hypothetical protein ABSF75_12900, partial [Terracidiphilus sp.]